MAVAREVIQPNRHARERFLSAKYSADFLSEALLPVERWQPFPPVSERAAWLGLPERVRAAHSAAAERVLAEPWPQLPATTYLQFARNGNRTNYEALFYPRRRQVGLLLTAECMEDQGRFLDALADRLWSICEESSWCLPAHISTQAAGFGLPDTTEPMVDLFAAEAAALLAWAVFLLGPRLDEVSPLIQARIRREVDQRVLTPALIRDDFWWMGFTEKPVNNWNPWINSNWLAAVLLLEPEKERRRAAVYKIMESLDRFITPYPKDGGCDEGPSYWGRAGASMFECLAWLHSATAGKIDVYGEPLIQEIGRFIYRAHIAGSYFINFADAPARQEPDPALVFHYGQAIGDPRMSAYGAFWASQLDLTSGRYTAEDSPEVESPGRLLPMLFALNEMAAFENPAPPLLRDVWLDEIQVMAARDEAGSSRGLYLAAKGGHNDESHNHNDVGHFMIYTDGKPLIVDAGVETYTRKTFSPQRYEIWTMQSAYHSLPTLDGVMQAAGREYAARQVQYRADEARAELALDLAGAYPPEAKLKSWLRTITLERGKQVSVVEHFERTGPIQAVTFSLITPCRVSTAGAGLLALDEASLADGSPTGVGKVRYDEARLTVTTEEIRLMDDRLREIWGEHLTRILFRLADPAPAETLRFEFEQ